MDKLPILVKNSLKKTNQWIRYLFELQETTDLEFIIV